MVTINLLLVLLFVLSVVLGFLGGVFIAACFDDTLIRWDWKAKWSVAGVGLILLAVSWYFFTLAVEWW